MSLRRFLERLIWLCMLPLVLMGSVLLLLHLHTLNERRQMLVDSVVRAAASSIDQMLEVRLSSLTLLSRVLQGTALSARGELNLQRAHELCTEYWRLHQNHVLIGSAKGQMLVNTRVGYGQPLLPLPEAHKQSAIKMAMTGQKVSVSDPFIGPVAGVSLFALSVPLQLPRQPAMVLASGLEIAQLQHDMSQAFNLPEGWVLRLYTRSGHEVFQVPGPAPEDPSSRQHTPAGSMRTASLSRAPWTVTLMAPPVSLVDDGVLRATLLVATLLATIALAYGGAQAAASRLTKAMTTLIHPTDSPGPTTNIEEVATIKAQLMALNRDRLAAQETERRRIGLELHDDLQQKLALIRQDLSRLPPGASRDRQLGWVNESIAATHRLVMDLRPPLLQAVGLAAALEALALQHQSTHGQMVEVSAAEDGPWDALAIDSAVALYRVAQEALTNALKHAQAHAVHLHLSGQPGGEVVLEIADDGVGFDFDTRARALGNGLRGMHVRMETLGGRLDVVTQPGDGTALVARLPWPLACEREG